MLLFRKFVIKCILFKNVNVICVFILREVFNTFKILVYFTIGLFLILSWNSTLGYKKKVKKKVKISDNTAEVNKF